MSVSKEVSKDTAASVASSAPVAIKLVTLSNATTALEVLNAVISIIKSKDEIEPTQVGSKIITTVIGEGNPHIRDNGQAVNIFNTKASTKVLKAKARDMIEPAAFLALSLNDAKEDAKRILNACSLSFSVDLSVEISKGDDVRCTPVYYQSKKTDQVELGLNFVNVKEASVLSKGDNTALDALLAIINAG